MSPTPDASSLVPTVDLSAPTATELTAVDAACRDHGLADRARRRATHRRHAADHEAFFAQDETVKGLFDAPWTTRSATGIANSRSASGITRGLRLRRPSGPTGHLNRWSAGHDEFERRSSSSTTRPRTATDTLGVIRDKLGLGDEHSAEELGFLKSARLRPFVPTTTPSAIRYWSSTREGLELGPTALGYHTDPGVLTLFLQDDTGGPRRNPPRMDRRATLTDAIVVNLGDTMQVWTNDQYKAAASVVPMTERSRYSIPTSPTHLVTRSPGRSPR